MPDGPPLRRRVGRVLGVVAATQALFVFLFVFPLHDPEPHGLPVAVAGGTEQARAFAERLTDQGDFEVTIVADVAAARDLVTGRDAYGAFVLGPGGGVRRLVTASGASFQVEQLLTGIAREAGAREVVDLRPVAEGDPRGVALNVLILPVTIAAILGALTALTTVPELGVRGRSLLAAATAALAGLIAVAIGSWWLDALPGPWLAEAALIALMFFAVGTSVAGLVRLVGAAGVGVAFLVFLMLGVPASGIASAPELLPSPWQEIGQLLPVGALGSAVRGVAYFDGAGVAGPVTVLVVWSAIGVALVALGDRRGAGPDREPAGRPATAAPAA